MLKKIRVGIKSLWYYCWGNFFSIFYFDKCFLRGRWFEGNYGGITSVGWEWATKDAITRLFTGRNKNAQFPVSNRVTVIHPSNIIIHPDNIDNFQSPGCYYQAVGEIRIGHGTYIGPNVGLITANHDFKNLDVHLEPKHIIMGDNCWIGMNSVVLPGVELGNRTIVGAGSVVTKSFKEGNCIIAGNPAKIIKYLD